MIKRYFLTLMVFSVFISSLNAQSICIDGKFNDWNGVTTNTDAANDGNGVDMRGFSVANDAENLYIRLITNTDINIGDSINLYMNIDADNNTSTGFYSNGIGADVAWRCGYGYGFYYHDGTKDTIYASQLGIAGLTTYKNDTFEIAISRAAQVGNPVKNLFIGNSVKINFVNGLSGGDYMPNFNSTYTYTFSNQLTSDFAPMELAKCNANYIRVMSYNVEFDGLIDAARTNQFKRVFQAINPDIIVLNECGSTSYTLAKAKLDSWLPLGTANGWVCYKVDGGNIICSKYPVSYATNINPSRKATVAYIDLPATYQTNLLVIGTHLMYFSDGDSTRQREADIISAYLRDMKAGTTAYKIPANTPFFIAGDFNMVNNYSPLNTMLTGNIVHTETYGTGSAPDWNGGQLSSENAKVADKNMTYTWRPNDVGGRRWPGKLDYILHSNTNLEIKKSFVLQSEIMSQARLTQYGLLASDSYIASDHLPIVADLQIPTSNSLLFTVQWNGKVNTAWENPANWDCSTVPDKYSNVVIPANVPNYPYVNYNTEIHSLTLNNGSTVNVKPTVKLLVNGQ
ncbi:endonuclease/exonuclease/phosphatase family protein [Ferruginibacter sp. SUN002]|uniref:endonuclease/exonuclease/phosphatase family protein n=1 Tax=Ferruginibacter sp. SUN002 TaxID=2937789 RepID=UPI003D366123